MTLPRELRWRKGVIVQSPVAELELARAWPRAEIISTLSFASTPWEVVVPAAQKSWRLEARQNGVPIFSLSRDLEDRKWHFARARASFPPDWADKKENIESIFTRPHKVPFDGEPEETRIIVDGSSVETYCDGGRIYFSAQIFPPGGEWQFELLPIALPHGKMLPGEASG
jgi:sucrose-6-phosphate hydrolase SacC (GH32 family)